MALAATTQVLEDGPRSWILKLSAADTLDPTLSKSIIPAWPGAPLLPTGLAIKRIDYNIEPATSVQLSWDATTDLLCASLSNFGVLDFTKYGFLQNNSGAGKTGSLLVAKTGSGAFLLIIWLIKQGAFG